MPRIFRPTVFRMEPFRRRVSRSVRHHERFDDDPSYRHNPGTYKDGFPLGIFACLMCLALGGFFHRFRPHIIHQPEPFLAALLNSRMNGLPFASSYRVYFLSHSGLQGCIEWYRSYPR